MLDFHGLLRRQKQLVAVDRALESHAFFGDFAQIAQAEHLKAARVGEDGFVPANKLVQAAAQATSPVVRTVAVGMDAGDYTETVTCDYTPVYVDDRFGGYCYVLGDAVWLPADAFAEMLGLESDTVTDGDTETVTVDGADITATYGATYYTANGRCFYAPDGVYALDGEVVLPLADLEKIFGVTAAFSADNTSLRVDASEQALLESGESYYGARAEQWLQRLRAAAWASTFCCCWADTAFWNRMPVEWAMLW